MPIVSLRVLADILVACIIAILDIVIDMKIKTRCEQIPREHIVVQGSSWLDRRLCFRSWIFIGIRCSCIEFVENFIICATPRVVRPILAQTVLSSDILVDVLAAHEDIRIPWASKLCLLLAAGTDIA